MNNFLSMFLAGGTTTTSPVNQFVQGVIDAKDTSFAAFKPLFDYVFAPIAMMIVGVAFAYNLMGFLRRKNEGSPYTHQLTGTAICLAIGVLISTWYVWGGSFLGV